MMKINSPKIKINATVLFLAVLCSCSNNNDIATEPVKKKDSVKTATKEILPAWNDSLASIKEGFLGVYEVPEMLSLCRLDSAPMKKVSAAIIKDFSLLEKDLHDLDLEIDGSQGIIYYNNSPENFKFECFLLVKSIPLKKPKHSQVVVLESAKMLVYNYYGPFENTFKAYAEIKKYCDAQKLSQVGQMREFYPLNQGNEKDQDKWLTRIMVPVIKKS